MHHLSIGNISMEDAEAPTYRVEICEMATRFFQKSTKKSVVVFGLLATASAKSAGYYVRDRCNGSTLTLQSKATELIRGHPSHVIKVKRYLLLSLNMRYTMEGIGLTA